MAGVATGAKVAGAASAGISAIAGMVPSKGGPGANIAAQSIFAASAAANAIPVAGQFVSAGLAIAGLFVKIFAGKRKREREEAAAKRKSQLNKAANQINPQQQAAAGVGQPPERPVGVTAPVFRPDTPSFSTWGGGSAPSIQPTQQAINNSIGIK